MHKKTHNIKVMKWRASCCIICIKQICIRTQFLILQSLYQHGHDQRTAKICQVEEFSPAQGWNDLQNLSKGPGERVTIGTIKWNQSWAIWHQHDLLCMKNETFFSKIQKNIMPTVKHRGGKIMIAGCFLQRVQGDFTTLEWPCIVKSWMKPFFLKQEY